VSEQDLVHVNVFRLVHGERHHVREGVSGDRHSIVERACVLSDPVGQILLRFPGGSTFSNAA
jgi:hypothetical protein